MTFTTRLCVYALLTIAAFAAWHRHTATDLARDETALAVRQFDNDASLPDKLQQASLAQNWWPLIWPALIIAVGIVMFWDDVERWWRQEDVH
ncbi:MAG: hypothetical protein HY289_09740 [Planctomycetes bacterium]|nr:hypothetical protein [Planctomycetota bacterium]